MRMSDEMHGSHKRGDSMIDIEKLIKDLRGKYTAYDATGNHNSAQIFRNAANVIEQLRSRIDELEEKQVLIDAYGDKWMIGGQDIPTAAYNHGFIDGQNNILVCRNCKYWSEVDKIDGLRYGQCDYPHSAIRENCFVLETWYCADGKRKVQE